MNPEISFAYVTWLWGDYTIEGQQRVYKQKQQNRCFHSFELGAYACEYCGMPKVLFLMRGKR